jgi:hypothetical protein
VAAEGRLDLAAILRLEPALIERVRRQEGLGRILVVALAVVGVGAGLYGLAFGAWRGPLQALFVALKLPLLFLAVGACTLVANTMLAAMLGARLSFRQSAVCVALALAIASTVLVALAPLGLYFVLNVPPPDPSLVGLSIDDPVVQPSLSLARKILRCHIAAVALASLVGIVRLHALLRELLGRQILARRVFVAWVLVQGLVGAELSWLLRPFLGKPHLPAAFLRQQALEGNVFEEVRTVAVAGLGTVGFQVASVVVLIAVVAVALHLFRARPLRATLAIVDSGLRLELLGDRARVDVRLDELLSVRAVGRDVHLVCGDRATFQRTAYRTECDSERHAKELAERLMRIARIRPEGAFRTSALPGEVHGRTPP